MSDGAGPPAAVERQAPAKLNLALRVTGRRADGYHELDSLIAFAGLADRLRAEPAEVLSLEVTGPFAAALEGVADNLALRAARALAERFRVGRGARLVLDKRLPVAAGLGGGSADAAATLAVLAELWGLAARPADLVALAEALGADVPVCLYGRPAFVAGAGERLEPAPALPPAWLVLANPGAPLSTAAVFARRTGPFAPPLARPSGGFATAADLAAWVAAAGNDLEAPARALIPEVDAALQALAAAPGCLAARMTGSGATCFGLFAAAAAAERAAAALAAARPAWWVRACPLAGAGPG